MVQRIRQQAVPIGSLLPIVFLDGSQMSLVAGIPVTGTRLRWRNRGQVSAVELGHICRWVGPDRDIEYPKLDSQI